MTFLSASLRWKIDGLIPHPCSLLVKGVLTPEGIAIGVCVFVWQAILVKLINVLLVLIYRLYTHIYVILCHNMIYVILWHISINLLRYKPLKEQCFFVGDEVFQKASFGMVDSGVTAEHLRLVAVPGLPGVKVCVVAQGLLIRGEAHVAHSSFRQGAQAEQALEKHSIGSFLPQPLQHSNGLT